MKQNKFLGAALLFQAVASLVSGAVLFNPLIESSNIGKTVNNIVSNIDKVYGSILLDSFTALGIIILAVLFYKITSKINRSASLIALGLYISEAAILFVNKILVYIFARYCLTGKIDHNIAQILLDGANFAYILHLLPFAIGAFIFYLLIYRSKLLPKGLSIWGVVSIIPFLIGVPLTMLGFNFPFIFYIPYVPFEFCVGLFLIVKKSK